MIDGAGVIVVEPFPTIEITWAVTDEPVAEATRTQLATVDLRLGEFPFLAEQDAITVSLVNPEDGSAVDLEFEPTEVVDGKVYQLNVFGSMDTAAEYELSASLSSTHLGRDVRGGGREEIGEHRDIDADAGIGLRSDRCRWVLRVDSVATCACDG